MKTPPEGVDDEAALLAYMQQLIGIENDPDSEPATLRIGPYTAIVLIGALQLATRHPTMSPKMRRVLRGIVDQLKPLFAGTPGEEIIRRGEHPEFDQ